MDKVFEKLNPLKVERKREVGSQFTFLTEGLSDFYLNLEPGMDLCNICASEALMKARFGIVCNSQGYPLSYDSTVDDYTLIEGIIAA